MTTAWILGGQLMADHPALAAGIKAVGQDQITVLLIQSRAMLTRSPYHRKKICLLLSAMRHYAEAMRQRGLQVTYLQADDMLSGLRQHFQQSSSQQLLTMAASHWHGRHFQETLSHQLEVEVSHLPDRQFIRPWVEYEPEVEAGYRLTHENFNREMRRRLGLRHFDEEERDGIRPTASRHLDKVCILEENSTHHKGGS